MIKNYWEEYYSTVPKVKTDKWLDKYKFLLKNCDTILDLGCGNGVNENYLKKIDIFPNVCDISYNAIGIMKKMHPRCESKVVDISKKLPYYDKQFDLIIADLSLHYFDNKTTVDITKELNRILKNHGFVVGRVNEIRGVKKEESYVEIEKNYYDEKTCLRRYFSREDIERYFSEFNVLVNRKTILYKYGYKKDVIEFLLQKDGL